MEISVQLPEDIARSIADNPPALQRALLEGLALEGVRSGRISRGQARRLLGLSTRYEVDGFLKVHGIPVEESFDQIVESANSIDAMRSS